MFRARSDVVGDGVVVVGGDGMVGAGPRVGVAHALALEIHVVVQVVSSRGLRLVIIDHNYTCHMVVINFQ